MFPLFESILIEQGTFVNLDLHERRMNRSRRVLFNRTDPVFLLDQLHVPEGCSSGTWKCRLVYEQSIMSVEFQRYLPKLITTLQLVHDDDMSYDHKYVDRSCFAEHLAGLQADDILIVKKGQITDTSYSNIAFFDGVSWWTPSRPLLEGTRRADLLARGVIHEAEIRVDDLGRYREAVLINAMLGMETGSRVPIRNILE